MPLAAVENLLQKRMGLHSSTVGSDTIRHAVEQRMRDCGITDIDDYARVVSHSETELNALIDTVIIPETWFFRDINPFDAFNHWLQEEWLPGNAGDALRILSVPCSSGEEAYTLAMCLADAGIPPEGARIDAIDISSINIEKATEGEYGRNSFRGARLQFRDRHFQVCDPDYRVNDNIREYVRFEQANMLDDSFSDNRAAYHVIFCRNLLIYFDRETQDAAIDRLEALLRPDGVLFLGHSETGLLLQRDFTALSHPRCFGFRRGRVCSKEHKQPRNEPVRRQARKHCCTAPSVKPEPLPFSQFDTAASAAPAESCNPSHNELLKQAFQLADEGHLGEAAEKCERLLAEQTHQANAYFLLGLIRESAGNLSEAERLLRKSVYLEPAHHEALVHLYVVCEQRGDSASARRFRERAARTASQPLAEGSK